MSQASRNSEEILRAGEFFEALGQRLPLRLLAGSAGLSNRITSHRIQKLGLALTGHVEYVHEGRVQFIGRTEVRYLNGLQSSEREKAVGRLFSKRISCIVITKSLDPPEDLLLRAEENGVAVFQTPALSSVAISQVTSFLEERLAPSTSLHGVLVEVFGVGVLLLGSSGIGKSECALDLILRGHRLVSDDLVTIRRFGNSRLVGRGPSDVPFHMELRGLGIVNIKELFGVSALSEENSIDLAIDLLRWDPEAEYDRLGVEEKELRILEVGVPLLEMPVAPGRNLATLVEVAVRLQMLKRQGYAPSGEFFRHLDRQLARNRGEQEDDAG